MHPVQGLQALQAAKVLMVPRSSLTRAFACMRMRACDMQHPINRKHGAQSLCRTRQLQPGPPHMLPADSKHRHCKSEAKHRIFTFCACSASVHAGVFSVRQGGPAKWILPKTGQRHRVLQLLQGVPPSLHSQNKGGSQKGQSQSGQSSSCEFVTTFLCM